MKVCSFEQFLTLVKIVRTGDAMSMLGIRGLIYAKRDQKKEKEERRKKRKCGEAWRVSRIERNQTGKL